MIKDCLVMKYENLFTKINNCLVMKYKILFTKINNWYRDNHD